jgi:hypothetical protein
MVNAGVVDTTTTEISLAAGKMLRKTRFQAVRRPKPYRQVIDITKHPK